MAKRVPILPPDQRAWVATARVQPGLGEYIGMALPSLSSWNLTSIFQVMCFDTATQAAARQMATYISLSHPPAVDELCLPRHSSLTHTFSSMMYISKFLALSCEDGNFVMVCSIPHKSRACHMPKAPRLQKCKYHRSSFSFQS